MMMREEHGKVSAGAIYTLDLTNVKSDFNIKVNKKKTLFLAQKILNKRAA